MVRRGETNHQRRLGQAEGGWHHRCRLLPRRPTLCQQHHAQRKTLRASEVRPLRARPPRERRWVGELYPSRIPGQPESAHSILEPIQASTSSHLLGQDGGTPRLARATGREGAQRLILHSSTVGGTIAGIPRKRTWRELARGILYLGLLCWHGQLCWQA